MKTQEELAQGLKKLASAIAEQENVTNLVAGIRDNKPRFLSSSKRFSYSELVQVDEWHTKLTEAEAKLKEASVRLEQATSNVFDMVPPPVVETMQKEGVTISAGDEGVEVYLLYLEDGKPKVLKGDNENNLYSQVFQYFNHKSGGRLGINDAFRSLY